MAIQQLSPALGSESVVAVAVLGLEALAAVVLVTVVVVTVLVAAAGLSVGFVDGSVAGSPVAGTVLGADGPSPGKSGLPVSPRRRRGIHGLDRHMCSHGTVGIHHAARAKGPARRRHKARGCKRPAQAGDAAVDA